MKKALKYLLIGVGYIIGIALIIAFSPIILLILLFQAITQPFEKKKFYASGFDKFTKYAYGITHTTSFNIYKTVKNYKFDLIINAFAGLDLYVFEKDTEINFVLCDDFEEEIYFSTEDNEWIYAPQHGNYKNANGEDKDYFNPFAEMLTIKQQRYPETTKPVNYYICVDTGFSKTLNHKGDKERFKQDKRFAWLFEILFYVDRTDELAAKEKPVPPLNADALYTIWSDNKERFCQVTEHSSGVFVYNGMAMEYDDYTNKYYWRPVGNGFASFFDTPEKAKQAAEDFLQGK